MPCQAIQQHDADDECDRRDHQQRQRPQRMRNGSAIEAVQLLAGSGDVLINARVPLFKP